MSNDPRLNNLGNPATEPAGHKARQMRAALAADQPDLSANAELFPVGRRYDTPTSPPSRKGRRETGL